MRGLDDELTNNSLSPKALILRILRVFTLDQKSVMKHANGSIIKEWYFLLAKKQYTTAKFLAQESFSQLEPLEISFESSIIAGSSWYNGDSLCAIWSGIIYNEG